MVAIDYSSNMGPADELQTASDVQAIADASIAALEVASYTVESRQLDATLSPTLTTGKKYILMDTSALHANFGTISGVANFDIVNYTGSAWEIFFDASLRGEGSGAYVKDENKDYKYNGSDWVTLKSLILGEDPSLENVLDTQVDATLDPGTPTEGDRYLITDSTALHANFSSPTVSDDDILEYIDGAFEVTFDASAKGEGFYVWDETANGRFLYNGSAWVSTDSVIDHTDLLNIGTKSHATIDTEVGANTTHSGGDGSDHADVATNTTHSGGDGSDHADVATNTTHISSDGKDHSDVVLNNTHRTSNGSDHSYIDQDVTAGATAEFGTINGGTGSGDDLTLESTTHATKGTVIIQSPIDLSDADAGQIIFPATQNPSADPNTMDDWETGSFTPTILGSTGGSGQAYSTQIGFYHKMGDTVHFKLYVVATTLGTITGAVGIGGLPFTSDSTASTFSSVNCGYGLNLNITAGNSIGGFVSPNTTQIDCWKWSATGGTTTLAVTEVTGTASFLFNGFYTI